MIKTLLLSGALLVAPITQAEEGETPVVETETPKEEVAPEDEKINWQEWLEKWFSPQQIALITTCITSLGAIIGFALKVKQLAKKDNLTQDNLQKLVKEELGKIVGGEVKPVLDRLINEMDKNKALNKLLVEIVALAQEDNAKSRLAIIELIAKLGIVDDETLEIAKQDILEDEKAEQEKKEQAKEEIKQIIEDTESEDEVEGLRI